jgi:hypothetical protein
LVNNILRFVVTKRYKTRQTSGDGWREMKMLTSVVVSYVHEVVTAAVVGFSDCTTAVRKTIARGRAESVPEAESCVSQTSQ